MLFFRSEEMIDAWCKENGHDRQPSVTMKQLWGLAMAWYTSRLDADARRPQPEEMRRIFAGLGLSGDFWDPQSDTFGTGGSVTP